MKVNMQVIGFKTRSFKDPQNVHSLNTINISKSKLNGMNILKEGGRKREVNLQRQRRALQYATESYSLKCKVAKEWRIIFCQLKQSVFPVFKVCPQFLGYCQNQAQLRVLNGVLFQSFFEQIFEHINCPLSGLILEPRKPRSEDQQGVLLVSAFILNNP